MRWGAALLELLRILAFGALTGGMGWALRAKWAERPRR